MKKEKKRKQQTKNNWKQLIPMTFFVLLGAGCGVVIAQYADKKAQQGTSFGQDLITFALLLLGMYLCILIHIVIHEAGHLICGLLTGYEFTSFRIGSFMWIKENGTLKMKRFSLAGTGGQCLMSPPEWRNGKIPVVLYNLGGCFMNLIVSVLCGILWFLVGKVTVLSVLLLMMVLVGIASAALNGIPMQMGTVNNDGYNALSLRKNSDGLYAFWLQMKVNGEINKGKRLNEMPEEWFVLPSDEAMKNSMVAVQGVFACNRLMDEKKFEEADRLMEHLLSIESGIVGIHRNLMICDRIYCELIGENREEIVEQMLTKELKKFMKSMKSFPAILRMEYAYELLAKKKTKKAEKIKKQFEKMALKYPYPSDIQSEQELMEYARNRAIKL